jgi:23S rRNA (adenine2503-C2)-methyltransferase
LAKKISGMICHVNLIPLNPTKKFGEQATSADQAHVFCDTLEAHNISCTVRLRRGIEIQAGCGQLATEGESK